MYKDFEVKHTALVKMMGVNITFNSMEIARQALLKADVPENATISTVPGKQYENWILAEWTTTHRIENIS